MKKYTFLVFAALLSSLLVAAEVAVPDSVQIYLAGVSGCTFDEEALTKSDSSFEKVKLWERPLASYYRFREWYFGGNQVIVDDIAGTISPYHALLTAHGQYGEFCDVNIRELFQRYINQGISVNQFSSLGYTPLHEAVISKDVEMVEMLMQTQVDLGLRVRSDNKDIKGMTAIGMAQLFESKNGDEDVRRILEILNSWV